AGSEARKPGEAKNSWLTGAAAWNYVAITQWVLGIRPDYDGLLIAPVIPQDWKGFSVKRIFRGVLYQIQVIREGNGNDLQIEVDHHPIAGNLIPAPGTGIKEVDVQVTVS
ncbi:MAG: glycosyl transferase, partial [Anaerolineaceae bacterium]